MDIIPFWLWSIFGIMVVIMVSQTIFLLVCCCVKLRKKNEPMDLYNYAPFPNMYNNLPPFISTETTV